jgi:hypothetical protein
MACTTVSSLLDQSRGVDDGAGATPRGLQGQGRSAGIFAEPNPGLTATQSTLVCHEAVVYPPYQRAAK